MNRYYLPMVILFLSACAGRVDGEKNLVTVEKVDIERYMGRWYEVAKIPNRFQSHCEHGAMAEYRLTSEGEVSVVNRCMTADGSGDKAEGRARIVDTQTNAKLEVSFVSLFGWNLFWGDYWIIGLGDNYEYAVIGNPGRRYGWVLARKTELSEAQWSEVKRMLEQQGYDFDDFERSGHIQREWGMGK